MKKIIFVFLFLIIHNHNAHSQETGYSVEERIKVAEQQPEEILLKRLLENLENSINNKDFISYSNCFDESYMKKEKNRIIKMFLEDNLSFEIKNFIISEKDDKNIEFYLKYSYIIGNESGDIVSVMTAKINNDKLFIAKELIENKTSNKNNYVQNSTLNSASNKLNKIQQKVEIEMKLFNDSNGQPDPDGIMWLDPRELARITNKKICTGGNCRR